MRDPHAFARHAVSCTDLTDLSDDASAEQANALAQRAFGLPVAVAALCIWPRFVAQTHSALQNSPIKVATVVNFPQGGEDIHATCEKTTRAVHAGADEIDLVLPWQAFLDGRESDAAGMIRAVRKACEKAHLKVILETGALAQEKAIRAASRLALAEGADFLKTSTGKIAISATPEAARFMLEEIQFSGRNVGFKASGGLRTFEQARLYFDLAEEIMGAGWATPDHFRYGASGLLDTLLQHF
ncbi:MAG: deoxyribose-phosphate aldolase [Pseudomonadota bacterium]|jgi:deoxyribose-phosphate aldolase